MRLSDPCQIPSSSSLLFVLPERREREKEKEKERERERFREIATVLHEKARGMYAHPPLSLELKNYKMSRVLEGPSFEGVRQVEQVSKSQT